MMMMMRLLVSLSFVITVTSASLSATTATTSATTSATKTTTTTTAAAATPTEDKYGHLTTIRLVPHHVHKERIENERRERMRRQLSSSTNTEQQQHLRRTSNEQEQEENTATVDSVLGTNTKRRRRRRNRRHYQRRRYLSQEEDEETEEEAEHEEEEEGAVEEEEAEYAEEEAEEESEEDDENIDEDEEQVVELMQGYGTHYVDLWCGTPVPQRQTVIVDTGSGVTAFPCSGCGDNNGKKGKSKKGSKNKSAAESCGVPDYHIDALFDEDESKTFQKVSCVSNGSCGHHGWCMKQDDYCKMGMAYQEGSSWDAYEAVDTCYIGGMHTRPELVDDSNVDTEDEENIDPLDPLEAADLHSFDLRFGCQTKITGLFKTQLADGIAGMDNDDDALWKQMYNTGHMSTRSFSLCFSRQIFADRTGTESGALTLGGTDHRLHLTPMIYTTFANNRPGFYNIHLRAVYLKPGKDAIDNTSGKKRKNNNQSGIRKVMISESDLNRGGIIVDSGTTDTYFSSIFGSHFTPLWKEMMSSSYHNRGIKLESSDELDQFPTIMFQFTGDIAANQQVQKEHSDNKDVMKNGYPIGLVGSYDDIDNDDDSDDEYPYDIIIEMPPQHYFEYDPQLDEYVSRFYVNERGGNGVLGSNFIMGYDIQFDIDNNNLGFANSHCDYTKLIDDNGYIQPVSDDVGVTTVKTTKTTTIASTEDEEEDEDEESDDEKDDKNDPDYCTSTECE